MVGSILRSLPMDVMRSHWCDYVILHDKVVLQMYVRLLIVDLEIDDSPGSQTSDMSLLKAESVWAGI